VENELHLDECKIANISASLKGLCTKFREYFLPMSNANDWICNAFDDMTFSSQILSTNEK
jgi:hypothetical protein